MTWKQQSCSPSTRNACPVIGAKWLVEMAEYISDNPQFIINGFVRSGITGAIDGVEDETESDNESNNSDHVTSDEGFSDLAVEDTTDF